MAFVLRSIKRQKHVTMETIPCRFSCIVLSLSLQIRRMQHQGEVWQLSEAGEERGNAQHGYRDIQNDTGKHSDALQEWGTNQCNNKAIKAQILCFLEQ